MSKEKLNFNSINKNDFYSLAKYYELNKDYNNALDYYKKYFLNNPSVEGENKILLKILFEVFVFLCPFCLLFHFLQLHGPPCA
jgi:two-component SAPR family response regulator